MDFQIIGLLSEVETIAAGREIRDVTRLKKFYGGTRWRKLKGVAQIRLTDGIIVVAELHWYEAHGVGKREMKIKRFIEE